MRIASSLFLGLVSCGTSSAPVSQETEVIAGKSFERSLLSELSQTEKSVLESNLVPLQKELSQLKRDVEGSYCDGIERVYTDVENIYELAVDDDHRQDFYKCQYEPSTRVYESAHRVDSSSTYGDWIYYPIVQVDCKTRTVRLYHWMSDTNAFSALDYQLYADQSTHPLLSTDDMSTLEYLCGPVAVEAFIEHFGSEQ